MTRVCLPARTPDDWRPLLAQPEGQWRAGRSAHALAHAWQAAAASPGGLPPEVRSAFAGLPALADARALLVVPEHVTPLPGGGAGAHSDVLVLARAADGLAVIAVEGVARLATAGEPFGPTVGEWLEDASPGGEARFAHVLAVLGLGNAPATIRYQLLHRTAAALIEADAYAATHAVVLVHAFGAAATGAVPGIVPGAADYAAFVALFGVEGRPGALASVPRPDGRWLHFAWADGAPAPATPPAPDDQLRDQLGAILGGPVEIADSALFTYGDPIEVLVRADPHAVHVEVPAVEWRGHTPVLSGERRASFPREAVTRLGGEAPFIEAVLAARAERVARFRACATCGERNPPEWMRGPAHCRECAERSRRDGY